MKSPRNTKGTAPAPGHEACVRVHEVLARIGDKWSVLVINLLGQGTLRFSELRRTVDGISQRMLTLTLRGLERDGIVVRTVIPTVPPRVEYSLSTLGRTLLKTVSALALWATENQSEIDRARAAFDSREVGGRPRSETGARRSGTDRRS